MPLRAPGCSAQAMIATRGGGDTTHGYHAAVSRRLRCTVAGTLVLLAAAVLVPPAQFVAEQVDVASPADLGALTSPIEWVPVWRLGPVTRGPARGRYQPMGLLLVGELCLIVSLGAGVAVATARTRSTRAGSPPGGAP